MPSAARQRTKPLPLAEGVTVRDVKYLLVGGDRPVAPIGARRSAPAPVVLRQHACAGRDCGNAGVHETPVGRLCSCCRDRWRGFSAPGIVHIGGLKPWQGTWEEALCPTGD